MSPAPSSALKQRILDAAVELLDTEGAAAMTVRAVAARAGCSTIGVYTHFTDKPGLIEAIVLTGFGDFGAALADATTAEGRAGLTQSALAYREWALANRTRYLVMFAPASPDFGRSDAVTESTGTVFAEHMARVESAVQLGEISGEVEPLAAHLWATIHGHVLLEINGLAGSAEAYHQAIEWIFDGVRG